MVRIVLAVIAAMTIGFAGLIVSAIASFPLAMEGGNPAPVIIPGLAGSLAVSGAAFGGIARWRYWEGVVGALASWVGAWLLLELLKATST
jgi:hypothetical protein